MFTYKNRKDIKLHNYMRSRQTYGNTSQQHGAGYNNFANPYEENACCQNNVGVTTEFKIYYSLQLCCHLN